MAVAQLCTVLALVDFFNETAVYLPINSNNNNEKWYLNKFIKYIAHTVIWITPQGRPDTNASPSQSYISNSWMLNTYVHTYGYNT